MADDPIPFAPFAPAEPAQFPVSAPPPASEPFREPRRRRRKKGEAKEPAKKRGRPAKPKGVLTPPPYNDAPAVQRPLSLIEGIDALNKLRAILNSIPPSQRKELLTYLLSQT